jgi:transcriptional regulator
VKPGEQKLQDGGIDAGLHLLSLVIPRGVELSQEEIAFVCGCTRSNISNIERRAMDKLRVMLRRRQPKIRELLKEL